ncbi:hypothetical protein FQA39_LY08698 [Lamprigera yunnana]|nr:hypothetical protein FQA39_LY08698 [Lamprigera yunnana]
MLSGKFILLITAIAVAYLGSKLMCKPPSLPDLNENEYWGPGTPPSKLDTSIKPFKIDIPDSAIQDLKHRLETDRPYTPPLENAQQQYGFNTNLLKEITQYWKNEYNWREREKFLNQFPQYKTNIQGLDIHYIHVKPQVSTNVKVLPLLMLHGWPGSVREFYGIIPHLTKESKGHDFVFEVITPSLPGYGFSQGASKTGMGNHNVAMIMKNLMKRIGFEKFYVQGGDWGAIIATDMATFFPKNILGLHSNMCMATSLKSYLKLFLGSIYPPLVVEKKYEHKMYPLSKHFRMIMEESGYFHLQATKPDSLGVSIGQSPSGRAAYILEKFSTATNFTYKFREDGGLKGKYTYDDLLDNLMLYWLPNSFTTAIRLYSEGFSALELSTVKHHVPCACARFGQELGYATDWILKDRYQHLVYTSDYDVGGHFIAMEEPELLAKDILAAISRMEELKHPD